jgi:hypothetical protein
MMMDDALVESLALVVGDDGDICQGIDGTQESDKLVHSQYDCLGKMVRPPGFEPGSAAWKAAILNHTRLWPHSLRQETPDMRSKHSSGVSLSDRSVEGLHHYLFGEQLQTLKPDDSRSKFKRIARVTLESRSEARLWSHVTRRRRPWHMPVGAVRVNLCDRLLEGSNHRAIRGSSQPHANRSVEGFYPSEEPISPLYHDRSMEGSYHAAKREPSLSNIDGSLEGCHPIKCKSRRDGLPYLEHSSQRK